MKRIALTFDDGPSPYTERILDVLKKNGARATFFLIGNTMAGGEETVKRAFEEGNEIGNHTYSHGPLTYMTDEEALSDITKTAEMIKKITGKAPAVVRAPYGDIDDRIKALGKGLGICFAGWSLDTMDWSTLSADKVFEEIKEKVKDGDIIICHDCHESTAVAMEKVIPYLISEGYTLVTFSELIEKKEAGEVYFSQISF